MIQFGDGTYIVGMIQFGDGTYIMEIIKLHYATTANAVAILLYNTINGSYGYTYVAWEWNTNEDTLL